MLMKFMTVKVKIITIIIIKPMSLLNSTMLLKIKDKSIVIIIDMIKFFK